MLSLFNLANTSYTMDTFVSAVVIYVLVGYAFSFSGIGMLGNHAIWLAFGCAVPLVSSEYYIYLDAMPMLTSVALASLSLFCYNSAGVSSKKLPVILNLLKSLSILISSYSMLTVVNILCVILHTLLACKLAAVNPVGVAKKCISQIFSFSGFGVLSKLLEHKFTQNDIDNAADNSTDNLQNFDKLSIDTTKKFFVARFLIMSEWKTVLAIIVGKTVVRVARRWRQLVFVSIIAIIQSGGNERKSEIITLLIIWQIMALSVFISSYLISVNNLLQQRMEVLLMVKILSNSNVGKHTEMPFVRRFNDYSRSLLAIFDKISLMIAELFNVWIIATRVGWYFAIPILIVMLQMCISFVVDKKINDTIVQNRLKESPKFYKCYYTAIKSLRIVKLHSWENLILDNLKPFFYFENNLPLFWKMVNILNNLLSNATTQISTAVTLITYIQSSGVAITYSELILLMDSTESLTHFTERIAGEFEHLSEFRKMNDVVEGFFRKNNYVYATHKPLSNLNANAIKLENCQFSWGPSKFKLRPITVSIKKGDFVTVIGKIGSGKSSLLEGLCGEMPIDIGNGCVYGRIAYVCQKPYIMDNTIRNNILMGAEYSIDLYRQVIEACALDEDIRQLVAADLTEIGPNGINLSGGQKVRLALARALYMQADVYLLDDVLSAVDARVERQLVERVLSESGMLGRKTRILVTHATHVVPLSNKVITMTNGHAELTDQIPVELSLTTECPTDMQLNCNYKEEKHSESASEEKYVNNTYILRPEENVKSVSFTHANWFIRHSGYLTILALVLVKLTNSYVLYFVESWKINLMLDRNPNTMVASLKWFLTMNAIVKIVSNQVGHIERWVCQEYWTRNVATRLLRKYIGFILSMPLPLSERLSEHKLSSIASNITYSLTNQIPKIIYNGIFTDIVSVVEYGFQIAHFSPLLLIPTVLFSVIVFYWNRKYKGANRNLAILEENNKYTNSMYYRMLYSERPFLRVHRLLDTFSKRLANLGVTHCNFQNIKTSVSASDRVLTSLLSESISTMVVLYSIMRFIGGKSDVSPAYIGIARSMVNRAVHRTKSLSTNIQSLANCGRLLTDVYTYSEGIKCRSEVAITNKRPDPNWPQNGTIEFCNYRMRYRPELEMVLKGLDFSVKHNEKIGIVGRTGAGKSSITYALMRIVEADSGYIKIDGVDISTLGVHDLRSKIAIIPQDPVLFEGTIRDNLDPECKHTDREVWAAIHACQFANILDTPTAKFKYNPHNTSIGPWVEGTGLNKWIECDGINFSVGQRQLVSLCRALLWKRKIIVLDEATANIDNETDRIMQDVLRRSFENCTILTIAHRLHTVMDSDRILVMDEGRAVEFDTPANLLANKSGYFTRLVESMKLNQNI